MRATVISMTVLVCAVALPGCGSRAPHVPAEPPMPAPVVIAAPTPATYWPAARRRALEAATGGRHAEADSILRRHAVDHPGDETGLESDFLRAILRADPRNPTSESRDARALLDAYMALGERTPRFVEAQVVWRLLERVDSARSALVAARAAAESRDRVRDEEIKRLNEELEKTKAELERIKQRLVPEKKPPGG
ncbi:MAG: hypothetical protein ACT4OZ_09715 [Gemmatimonadota bacterium]